MDREFLTDEDIHGLEEDSEIVKLRNEVDKLKQKLEEKEDTIKFIKEKLEHDIKVNERCLEEEIKDVDFKRLLSMRIKFDKELLEATSDE